MHMAMIATNQYVERFIATNNELQQLQIYSKASTTKFITNYIYMYHSHIRATNQYVIYYKASTYKFITKLQLPNLLQSFNNYKFIPKLQLTNLF